MSKDEALKLAREAGLRVGPAGMGQTVWGSDEELERFAALIRADERSSWPAEMEAMERQVNILTDALAQAKADEREACEALHDHEDVLAPVGNSAWGEAYQEGWGQGTAAYRDAIRARSNT